MRLRGPHENQPKNFFFFFFFVYPQTSNELFLATEATKSFFFFNISSNISMTWYTIHLV